MHAGQQRWEIEAKILVSFQTFQDNGSLPAQFG